MRSHLLSSAVLTNYPNGCVGDQAAYGCYQRMVLQKNAGLWGPGLPIGDPTGQSRARLHRHFVPGTPLLEVAMAGAASHRARTWRT